MKAIRIHEHGSVDVLKIDIVPDPQPAEDEILVRIKSTALNHLDLWVREGLPGISLPIIMGSDAAGIVEKVGALAAKRFSFKREDEVVLAPIRSCGHCPFCVSGKENLCPDFRIPGEGIDGVQVEYVAIPARFLLHKPAELTWAEAAAFPLAAMTAYHMLARKAMVSHRDWVLVYGASSGVGSAAIQLAKAMGARVITTVGSDEKGELAKKLGADFVIHYKKEKIGKTVREITNGSGVDIVIEHTGAQTWPESLRALRRGGKLVTCGATTGPVVKIDIRALFVKHQQLIGSTMGTMEDLYDIVSLIKRGLFKPVIDKEFSSEDIKEAHFRLSEGRHFGKVVIHF